ncbi:MAG: prepilin-type N-terminal cleavage/methylation domain-containing protein [Patescibacteria group bacterium]
MKKLTFSRGFTLVELLVVIAIIGILATLLLLQLNTARGKARDTRRGTDVSQIRTAVEEYYDENGVYPATLGDPDMGKFFQSGAAPKDPSTNVDYKYHVDSGKTKYQIVAKLENKNAALLGGDADFTGSEWTGAESGADSPDFLFDLGIK